MTKKHGEGRNVVQSVAKRGKEELRCCLMKQQMSNLALHLLNMFLGEDMIREYTVQEKWKTSLMK
jgi:hypothetical protein